MSSPQSKEDWKARIEPHLSTSLRAASDEITRTAVVQEWLQTASMEAAEGMAGVSGMQGEMQGYMRMMKALEDRFPELLDAIHELTEGCGRVDLHWRPLNPNYSRLYIEFDRDFTVKLFHRLSEATPEAAREAIRSIENALPGGRPFPNRPNTVTGLVAFEGQCTGVRIIESQAEDQQRRHRRVHLLTDTGEDRKHLSPQTAAARLLQVLASVDSTEL